MSSKWCKGLKNALKIFKSYNCYMLQVGESINLFKSTWVEAIKSLEHVAFQGFQGSFSEKRSSRVSEKPDNIELSLPPTCVTVAGLYYLSEPQGWEIIHLCFNQMIWLRIKWSEWVCDGNNTSRWKAWQSSPVSVLSLETDVLIL